ncbi:MAG: hypothetical protein COA84_09600 [Robiginitomaculum sp.]|nr:MAG: hypothetical protein COA84_09600 [Robiginitomaculum sp.]
MSEDEEFNGIYLCTDEHLEFIDALKTSANFSKEVLNNTYAMKWLILALHAALQGACVCALESIHGQTDGSLSVKSQKEYAETKRFAEEYQDIVAEYNNGDRKKFDQLSKGVRNALLREPKLADFLTLFEWIKNPERLLPPYTFNQNIGIYGDVKRLHKLRNNVIHFTPKGWSVELSGMPRIVSSVTEVIEHLAVKQPSFTSHLTDENVQQVKQSLEDIRNNISEWARQHNLQDGPRPAPG